MANFIINSSLNVISDIHANPFNEIDSSATDITISTTRGTTQDYHGSFTFSGGVVAGGTVTSITETLSNQSKWYEITGASVPFSTFQSYILNGNTDSSAFLASALRGNDVVSGSNQNDTIWGYAGNDSISSNGGADNINGNMGNDTVQGGQDNDIVQGGQGNDFVHGNLGSDTINGNLGNDIVQGGQGNDFVAGGQGNDTVYGDLGNDTISGDLGGDQLIGGDGADIFVFGANTSFDSVLDFHHGVDKIKLQGVGINSFAQLSQDYLGVDGNGNASILADNTNFITLIGVAPTALDANDFIFS